FDLVLLQEPWVDTLEKTQGLAHYRVIYPPTVYKEASEHFKSIILIHMSVSTDIYSTLSVDSKDITAIWIKSALGYISIFNIY
ncbi:hypothetical protein C8Q75DRAFT_693044, partial [Abortiporus biennis]